MRIVSVKMPESYVEAIDYLVRIGRYSSRSEAIRTAVRELLRKELWIDDHRSPSRVYDRRLVKIVTIAEDGSL